MTTAAKGRNRAKDTLRANKGGEFRVSIISDVFMRCRLSTSREGGPVPGLFRLDLGPEHF